MSPAPPLTIAVSGASGRMGRSLAGLIAQSDAVECTGGIARTGRGAEEAAALGYTRIVAIGDAADVIDGAAALIDFSAPEQLGALIGEYGDRLDGTALVVGTTGLDAELEHRLDRLAGRVPVLTAANFSIGVNVLLGLVERAARQLAAERYDAEVVEAHHRRKADAPSGTALALGRAIASARKGALEALRQDGRSGRTGERPTGPIGFHAIRGGDVAGEHRVLFLGERERVELAHAAHDRTLFAEGALYAAHWLTDRPAGRYTMADVLED